MPTRNVSLTPQLNQLIVSKVASGRYENASEVIRAALSNLEHSEREYEPKIVGQQKQTHRFKPVPVRGEPVSLTILKDRGAH